MLGTGRNYLSNSQRFPLLFRGGERVVVDGGEETPRVTDDRRQDFVGVVECDDKQFPEPDQTSDGLRSVESQTTRALERV